MLITNHLNHKNGKMLKIAKKTKTNKNKKNTVKKKNLMNKPKAVLFETIYFTNYANLPGKQSE